MIRRLEYNNNGDLFESFELFVKRGHGIFLYVLKYHVFYMKNKNFDQYMQDYWSENNFIQTFDYSKSVSEIILFEDIEAISCSLNNLFKFIDTTYFNYSRFFNESINNFLYEI